MAYEQFEGALIESFEEDVKRKKINPVNTDLKTAKAKKQYNKYINDIAAINPREYKTTDFRNIGQKNIINLTIAIIVRIFGDSVVPKVIEFFKRVISSGTTDVLDGITLSIIDKRTNQIERVIQIPDLETTSNIVTLVHEFIHFYFKELQIDHNKKRYYEEIFSIYGEKLACHFLEDMLSEPKYTQKIEEVRLEGITWHYKTQAEAVEGVIDLYSSSKRRKNVSLDEVILILTLEQQIPQIKTSQGISILRQYYQNLADSYGIGYLYGESLFQKYLDDRRRTEFEIRSIIRHEKTPQEVLDYFNINATNPETYDAVSKRLQKIKENK